MTQSLQFDGDSLSGLPISDRGSRRFGFIVLLVVFGIFGGWAALAPIDGAVSAPGVVTVQTYRKTVQHLEGGIVKDILVRDGDMVRRGDPLIILDDSQLRAEYEVNRDQLIATRAMDARLVAERDKLSIIDFGQLEDDSNTPRGIEARTSEIQVFQSRRHARLGEISVLEERIGQLREQIKGTENIISAKRLLEKSYVSEIADLDDLLQQGFIDKQRVLDQQRKLDTLKGEIAEHLSSITRIRLQINETELQIVQINRDFEADVAKQLAEVQTRAYELQERTAALADRLGRIVIRAPDDGMILGMQVHTVGGVVGAATPLMEIVPTTSDLIIEAEVATNDINRIALGGAADIRFTAFNTSTTPVIEGTVINISGDRLTNEQTGIPYYLARIQVSEEGARKLEERQLRLLAGMPAEVLIKTGERTLLSYLLQPARDAVAQSLIEE